MKYYVTADIHGYYTYLKTALEAEGFFDENNVTEWKIYMYEYIKNEQIL